MVIGILPPVLVADLIRLPVFKLKFDICNRVFYSLGTLSPSHN